MRHIKANKTKTGQAAKSGKKWQWAEQMEAFRPFLSFAKTVSNVTEIMEIQEINTNDSENPLSEDHSQSQFLENIHDNILDTDTDVPRNAEAGPASATTNLSTPRSAVTKKRKLKDEPPSSVNSLIAYFQNKSKSEMDETEMLFLAHARSIKKLSNKNQAIVKMKIAKIIMEQELLDIEEQGRNQDISYYRPSSASSAIATSISYTSTSSPNYEYFGDSVEKNSLQPVNNTSDENSAVSNYFKLYNPNTYLKP